MSFTPRPGLPVFTADNRPLTLDREIGKGGEGSVWSIAGATSSQIVAKFYHQGLGFEKARKIETMCRLKSDALLRIAAWPTDIVRPTGGAAPQGLLMPKIAGYQEAHLLYTPKSRRTYFPEAQFPFILHAATNIARAFATVHDAGQVIGDVNHANLMISSDAMVKLIDCDSFEITDGSLYYPCLVGVPTYTPPELQGKSFTSIRRTAQHDAFGLAVLLFHMLYLGRHPFSGIFRQGRGDKTVEDAIRELRFAYLPNMVTTEMDQLPWVPRLSAFPADIGALFLRAFGKEGVSGGRPTAHNWIPALESLSQNLKRCAANTSHHFHKALISCPWCKAEKGSGIPMFGITVTVVRTGEFNLLATWAQIEAIRPDISMDPQFGNAYVDQCTPDPGVSEVLSQRRKKRILATGIVLLAVGLAAPGTFPALVSISMLIAALVAGRKLWRSGTKLDEKFTKERQNATRSFDAACAQWYEIKEPPRSFEEAKKLLQAQRHEYEALASLKAARMDELRAELRKKQLTRYLEGQRIEDATITGVGPGRKSLLIACGIEDASDVHPRIAIKGFGPGLKSNLLAWRRRVEQGFAFNPNEAPDPGDVRVVEQQIEQKRAQLIQALSNGPTTLKQVLHSWQVARVSVIANVEFWRKAAAQAQTNYKALGRI